MIGKLKYAILVCVMSMAGCASTQQFVPKVNVNSPSADKALIQVQRQNSVFGSGRSVAIADNGKAIGEVANGDSLAWERPEGEMKLSLTPSFGVVREGIPPAVQQVKAGKTYLYIIEWRWSDNSFVIHAE